MSFGKTHTQKTPHHKKKPTPNHRNLMCHRKGVEETKVPEMALDYLDNTLGRSEKAHDSYFRALQKSNQISQKTQTKKSTKTIKKPSAIPFSQHISC